jgi:hypothetical protein
VKQGPEEVVAKTAIELLVDAVLDRDGNQPEIYAGFARPHFPINTLVPFPDPDHIAIEPYTIGFAGKRN